MNMEKLMRAFAQLSFANGHKAELKIIELKHY
jgi:hypothetical protein